MSALGLTFAEKLAPYSTSSDQDWSLTASEPRRFCAPWMGLWMKVDVTLGIVTIATHSCTNINGTIDQMAMFTQSFRILIATLLIFLPLFVYAKCQTSRIVAVGDAHPQGVQITEPELAGRFNIWNGPKVRVNGEAIHLNPDLQDGHFIDWSGGPVHQRPSAAVLFTVSFFCFIDSEDSRDRQIYIVDYLFSPEIDGGYIFLPGRGDARFAFNTESIVHGVEGSWFRSTKAWEDTIRPILDRSVDAP